MKGVASRMPQALTLLSCREEPFRTSDEISTSLIQLFIDILVPKLRTVRRYLKSSYDNLLPNLSSLYSNGSSLCSLGYWQRRQINYKTSNCDVSITLRRWRKYWELGTNLERNGNSHMGESPAAGRAFHRVEAWRRGTWSLCCASWCRQSTALSDHARCLARPCTCQNLQQKYLRYNIFLLIPSSFSRLVARW